MKSIGGKIWAIPEGYIPSESTGTDRTMISHEAMCFLNAAETDGLSRRAGRPISAG